MTSVFRMLMVNFLLCLESCTALSALERNTEVSGWCYSPGCDAGRWAEYHDATCGFSLCYPKGSKIFRDDSHRVHIAFPVRPGTNLTEKYVDISCGFDLDLCGGVSSFHEINGIIYQVQQGEDVAAGNLYEWMRYSVEKNGRCFAVTFVLHSGHPGDFYPPVAVYDRKKEFAVFNVMMSSLRLVYDSMVRQDAESSRCVDVQ